MKIFINKILLFIRMIDRITNNVNIEDILNKIAFENYYVKSLEERDHFFWNKVIKQNESKGFEVLTPINPKKCLHGDGKVHSESRFAGLKYVQTNYGVLIPKEIALEYNLNHSNYEFPKLIQVHIF